MNRRRQEDGLRTRTPGGQGAGIAESGVRRGAGLGRYTGTNGRLVRAVAAAEAHEPTLGDCWVHAVAHYYDAEHLATIRPTPDWYPASIFFQGMKFMVFGDPALRLPDPWR